MKTPNSKKFAKRVPKSREVWEIETLNFDSSLDPIVWNPPSIGMALRSVVHLAQSTFIFKRENRQIIYAILLGT